jgi:HTH-type transcriptional regulator/antitoxin HigA
MSLRSIPKLKRYQVAFRFGKSAGGERSPEAIAAWLRVGERRAQRMFCAPFSEDRLRSAIEELRAMTLQEPDEFQEILRTKLADCGIALVICPHFTKTNTHGATFRLGREKVTCMGREKIVLMITIRGKWADIFWFSLFHEIGHILLHNRNEVILEQDVDDHREQEADTFAADTLIPPDAYQRFIQRGSFSSNDINVFAQEIEIDAGIIVGRLHHDLLLRQDWGNGLRSRYD